MVEKPGQTKDEAPRRWHGQRVRRYVEVEYGDGRVDVEALAHPEEDAGWTELAITIDVAVCLDADLLEAYQDHNTTVEPAFRGIKNPAAIAPVWLEKPERIAAFAMLTGVRLAGLQRDPETGPSVPADA